MNRIDKLFLIAATLNIFAVAFNISSIMIRRLEYDSLFAKCELDKEIVINGNKYLCIKIQKKRE